MSARASGSTSGLTVAALLKFLVQHQIDDDKIYRVLCGSLRYRRYKELVGRIKIVVDAQLPVGVKKAVWQGRQSRIKGRLFEKLIVLVLKAVEPFRSWTNVNTTTRSHLINASGG